MADDSSQTGCGNELCVGCTPQHFARAARVVLCIVTLGISEALRGKKGWFAYCMGPETQSHHTREPQMQMERRSSERASMWVPAAQTNGAPSAGYPEAGMYDRGMSPVLQQQQQTPPMSPALQQQAMPVLQIGDGCGGGAEQYVSGMVCQPAVTYQPQPVRGSLEQNDLLLT